MCFQYENSNIVEKEKSDAFDVKYENQSGKIWLMNAMQYPIIQTCSRWFRFIFFYFVLCENDFPILRSKKFINYKISCALYIPTTVVFPIFLLPFYYFFFCLAEKNHVFLKAHINDANVYGYIRVYWLKIENIQCIIYQQKAAGIYSFYMRR